MRSIASITAIFCTLALTACSEPEHALTLRFQPSFGDERIGCQIAAGNGAVLTDLKFFIHGLQVRDDAGEWHDATISTTAPWQTDNLALVDLEDGTGACQNGSLETYSYVAATSPIEAPKGIRFTVGVPFDLNHMNPALAQPPLTYTLMHWHWQAGYKFIRAGLVNGDQSGFLHLGSTQCQGTIGDISGCDFPNRVQVIFNAFDPAVDWVLVDVKALMGAEPQGPCMAERDDPGCTTSLMALGLDGTSEQIVFRQ